MQKKYIVKLKNGEILKFWFIGNQIKKIFEDYNIPYEIEEVEGLSED